MVNGNYRITNYYLPPPEITAINLTTSPSRKISSSRIISPARVAITDSDNILIFFNESNKVIPGFTSYSLSRKINFTVILRFYHGHGLRLDMLPSMT